MTTTTSDTLVDYRRQGAIVTLTLDRADKLNAFSDELVGALSDALHRFDMDDEAHIAIVAGRGRAFSSGADVQQRQLRSRDEFLRLGGPQGRGTHSADLLTKCVNWKPVVAAAHGYVWAWPWASCSSAIWSWPRRGPGSRSPRRLAAWARANTGA